MGRLPTHHNQPYGISSADSTQPLHALTCLSAASPTTLRQTEGPGFLCSIFWAKFLEHLWQPPQRDDPIGQSGGPLFRETGFMKQQKIEGPFRYTTAAKARASLHLSQLLCHIMIASASSINRPVCLWGAFQWSRLSVLAPLRSRLTSCSPLTSNHEKAPSRNKAAEGFKRLWQAK